MLDYRIENALLIDGSGRPGIPGSLGVKNGMIAALGRLDGETTAQRIDAKGRCLTPGFLDIHRHADAALFRPGFGRAELAQGLTTIVNGNCGLSLAPAPRVRRREIYEYFDEGKNLVRPANFHREAPGVGYLTLDFLRYQLCVVNLQGVVYMEPLACPFETLDRLLGQAGNPKFCIVDFHAEATAEKKALGYYADGRISALFGTHTHVQTADE